MRSNQTKLSSVLRKLEVSSVNKYDFMWIVGEGIDVITVSDNPVPISELVERRLPTIKMSGEISAVYFGKLVNSNPETILYESGATREVVILDSVEEVNDWAKQPVSDKNNAIIKVQESDGYTGVVYKLINFHEATISEKREVYNML